MKNLPIQVPKIPATFSKTLIERFKTLQTQLAKAAATLPKQFDLQRQFYSNIRLEPVTLKVLVPVKKTDNPDLTQQVTPKPEQRENASKTSHSHLHDDEYYLNIKDHSERAYQMYKDGMTPDEISKWEKKKNNEHVFDTFLKRLPSTAKEAVRKRIQRYIKRNQNR